MRRLLTSLAVVAATALTPALALAAPAHATTRTVAECVGRAVLAGVNTQVAKDACAAAKEDVALCVDEFDDEDTARTFDHYSACEEAAKP
ncbi:hypothetical protein ACIQ9P_32040 [Kitasatospora sp. NPDC094019]|uniref:hypothetical protein n=1 Tax=Kitasatospora sp. NPDC094019 TaxID=3364091 RepID=UPI00380110E6